VKSAATPLSLDAARVRAALVGVRGNITRAAAVLGVSKPYTMWLVARHGLRDEAREMRAAAGMAATGRPRKI
jgi:hypothetical protein